VAAPAVVSASAPVGVSSLSGEPPNSFASRTFLETPSFLLVRDRTCCTVTHALSFPFDYALLEAASNSSLRLLRLLYDSVFRVAGGVAAARSQGQFGRSGDPAASRSQHQPAAVPGHCLNVGSGYTVAEARCIRSALLYYLLAFGEMPSALPEGVSFTPQALSSGTPLPGILPATLFCELQSTTGGERARLQMMAECLILRAIQGVPGLSGPPGLLTVKASVMGFPRAAGTRELGERLAESEVPLLSGFLCADRAACGICGQLRESVLARAALRPYLSSLFSLEDIYLYRRYGERYLPYLRFLALSARAIGATVALDSSADPMEEAVAYLGAVHGEVAEGRRSRRGQLVLSVVGRGERRSCEDGEARLALAGLEYLCALRAEYRAAGWPALPATTAHAAALLAPDVSTARLNLCSGSRETQSLETIRQASQALASSWERQPGGQQRSQSGGQPGGQDQLSLPVLSLLDQSAFFHHDIFPRALLLALRLYGAVDQKGQPRTPLVPYPHLPEDVALSCARAIASGELRDQGGMLILSRLPERRAPPCSAGEEDLPLTTRPAHSWMADELEREEEPAGAEGQGDLPRAVIRAFLDTNRGQGARQGARLALEEVSGLIPGL